MISPEPGDERIEASVMEELEAFVREARGPRALAAVGPDASLERDLGLGSLERVELLSRLESRFRRKAPERTLGEAETARDLARAFLGPAKDLETDRSVEPLSTPPRSAIHLHETTLTGALEARARVEPERPHIYLQQDDGSESTVTYLDLYCEALLVAGALDARGIRDGETVAILLGTSRAFFSTFMGTLFAGGIPVPLYPPAGRAKLEEYARRQSSILSNSEARLLVTVPEAKPLGAALRTSVPTLHEIVDVESLLEEGRRFDPSAREIGPGTPALIQYTSGSTGDPKGVLLTHQNLVANARAIGRALRIEPSDVGVSWLPLYHDMGLIGAWLTPMYFGFPVAILPPLAFLARPERWLWTIHRKRATISPAPNFAYEICARKIADRDLEGLDLSSWRAALNGAEPIAPETLDRFEKRFAPCGFRRTSFLPVYGLAESSLLLAAPRLGSEARIVELDRDLFQREGAARPARAGANPLRFVSVGRPIPDHEVIVVDDRGEALPEGVEGRLLFRGPSAMEGYFRNAAATEAVLRPGGFLDSGDRAFLLDGELFVTGRAKDLIIKAGRNLVPQELESAACSVEGVRAGSVAAFGVADPALGTERVVVLVETKEETAEARARIESEVERAIVDLVGIPPDEVRAVPARSLPKTSSGKIRRSACRESYLSGTLGKRRKTPGRIEARLALHSGLSMAARGIGRALRLLYGGYVYFLSAAFVLPGWLLVRLGLPRGALLGIVRRASGIYLALAGIPLEVRGRDLLRGSAGPFVVIANHASYLDPIPLMAALRFDHVFAVKREAASWPLLGPILRRLEHVFVDRERVEESASAAEALEEALSRGRSVILFPEGTFSRATGLRPFKLGAFQLAARTGAPLVPVALVGTRRVLRDGTWIPRRVPIRVEIGAPIEVAGAFAEFVRVREQTADLLARLAGEPRLEG